MTLQMHVGFIVGSIIASGVLIAGIFELVLSKRRGDASTWAGWAVLFGVCALVSAVINGSIAS